ncbi:MAG: two-component regulator propeller domain-containing protein, partial [Bacteroidota bacterium]
SPAGQLFVGGYGRNLSVLEGDQFSPLQLPFPSSTLITDIDWNQEGECWVSTQNQGVAKQQLRDSSWVRYSINEGLPSRYVKSILVDEDDLVWLGTSGAGLCQYTGLPFVQFDQKSGLPEQAVYALAEDRECRIWMGNGLTVGYLTDQEFVNLREAPGFRRTKYKSILEDSRGQIWLGTEGQGVALVTDTGFVWFDRQRGLASDWVRSLAEGPDSAIWVGTASSGLSRISQSTDTTGVTWSITNQAMVRNGRQPNINQIIFDRLGQLWVCTRDQWLYRGRSGIWTQWLTDLPAARDLRSMAFDDQNRLWLGTADAGLIKVEFLRDTILKEQIVDNLSSEVVYLIAFDDYGSLWVGSEQGMDRVSLDEAGNVIEVAPYSKEEGFSGIETTQNAALKDREGRMWFGTINGAGRWQEGLRTKEELPPHLVLEEVRLFYENLRNTPWDTLLSSWNELTAPLILPHNRNHLSFDLAGIDIERADEVLYQWKLMDSEPEWSPASQRQTATFSNLSPGEYTFLARAGFPEGFWSEPVRVSVTI